MGEVDARSAITLAVVALLGVSAPVFALSLSIVAFGVAMFALKRVNDVVKQLEQQAEAQASEITELAADPSRGGAIGDG